MLRTSFMLSALVLASALPAQAVSLFDGSSLKDWDGAAEVWSVHDGRLVGHCDGSLTRSSVLVWRGGEVGDFVLRFRARLVGEADAGLLYRGRRAPGDDTGVTGYRAVLGQAAGDVAALRGEWVHRGTIARRGELVEVDASTGRPEVLHAVGDGAAVDVAEFHDYTITARGNRLIHEIDGVVAVDVTDGHRDAASAGIVALQIDAGKPTTVTFEDIVLLRLDGDAELAPPQWIWSGDDDALWFRRSFSVATPIQRARLHASCDNRVELFVNGHRVLTDNSWESPSVADVGEFLRPGDNVLAAACKNDGGPAALAVRLDLVLADGSRQSLATDARWRVASSEFPDWTQGTFDDSPWRRATTLGPVGGAVQWTSEVGAHHFGLPSPPAPPQPTTPADALEVLPGFRVDLVYKVPRATQGSWVSLTTDDRGRLIASAQKNAGLFRITPSRPGDPESLTVVERIDVPLSSAQGLLWAFGSLYVMVNDDSKSGLYRVLDTDGDDRLDTVRKLRELDGSGEHGPHAILLAPDGQSLICNAGNHTNLPAISGSRLPPTWGEDLLLPRQWDAKGHARGRLAPGGWICRVDPDGARWELISSGYRNEYDIAFNVDGELFAFDADMEWDMGMPWYRPTRLCHAVSGSEFGWRSGTGKWPTYYPDSLPPVLEIGPGSPTGIVFGTGARFPARYQRALFLLDWTFGTIYAIHMTPEGASYRAEKEEFVSGQPLPVTDAVVGADGTLYFTVGGRGLESALYRAVYTGDEDVAAASHDAVPLAAQARALRARLEAFHGHHDPVAIDTAWPFLDHDDRFVRYAARVAVESQPVADWQERALAESEPRALVSGLLALARLGDAALQPRLLDALGRLDLSQCDTALALDALRVYGLALIRMGAPDAATRRRLAARLDGLYPAQHAELNAELNAELVQLLVFLDAPAVIDETLQLMASTEPPKPPPWGALIGRNDKYGGPIRRMLDDMPPTAKIWYAFTLRNVSRGWTLEQRRDYFGFFPTASRHPGGESYKGFLENIRTDALAGCSEAERLALVDITGEELAQPAPIKIVPPRGPGRIWTPADARSALENSLGKRDFERGRNLFHATQCATCHRFDGEGGSIGPDLTSAGNKFSTADLLEAILEPSKVISDQYGSSVVTRKDGSVAFGRVVRRQDGSLDVHLPTPGAEPLHIPEDDVAGIEESPVSQMPAGLLTPLNEDELRDLTAYLLSRGDREDPMFR